MARSTVKGQGLEVRRLVLPVVSMFVAATLLTLGTVVAAMRFERAALIEDSVRRAVNFLQVRSRLLQRTLRDHARWNEEAVDRLLGRFDAAWADRNLGRDFVVNHDLSHVVVIDQGGQPIYAARSGEPIAGAALDRYGPALRELVRLARASSTEDPPTTLLAIADESVHLAAASRLTTQAAPGASGSDTGAVLVLMRRLDGPMLRQVAEDYGLRGYRIVATAGEAGLDEGRLPLRDGGGRQLATLTWYVAAPGSSLLRFVLPIALAGHAAIGVLLYLFLVRARRLAAGVEREVGESDRRGAMLAQREGHLRAILSQIADGILELDLEHRIRGANEAAARILGLSAVILDDGPPLARFLAGGEEALRRLLDGAEAAAGDAQQVAGLAGDGREIALEVAFATSAGAGPGRIAVIRDVSGRERARHLLDLIASAVVVVDGHCRKLFANQGAEALLAAGDGLRAADGGIAATGAASDRDLRRAVAAAAEAGSGAIIRLTRAQGRLLHAFVAPLRAPERRTGMPVVITLRDPEAAWELSEAELGRLFGLTPAEARVVAGLVKGQTLREIADQHGLSPNTVRNQLAQAFQKTGTARQSELVALALSSAGALAAIRTPEPAS